MITAAAVGAAGSAAATAIAAVKNMSDLVKGLKPNDPKVVKQQVSDLLDVVIEVKQSVSALTDENAELVREIAELKRQQSQPPEVVFSPDDNCYWKKKADGTTEGPFCPTCYNKDKRLIPLGKMHAAGSNIDVGVVCSVCKWSKYNANVGGGPPSVSFGSFRRG